MLILLLSCSPSSADIFLPLGDIKPPSVIEAGQKGSGSFEILFDENVEPVGKSFSFNPTWAVPSPEADGALLTIKLDPAVGPGEACSLSGEVRDGAGNTTRFLFTFVGYNERPAALRLNEVQTGKNSSASSPHRDYLEFTVEKDGNIGGVQVQWASSVKVMSYIFPPCEVSANSLIVLHCAPEGNPAEKDETGKDLSLSGGIDASGTGRDFWTSSGGIPDETGLVLTRVREEAGPADGIFFVSSSKAGEVDSPKLVGLLDELAGEGLWSSSSPPLWEEGFLWKSSPSRPLHRKREADPGPEQWYVGESGSQSPGRVAPGVVSSGVKKAKKIKR